MAKAGKKDGAESDINVVCKNRRALHDYEIIDRMECGIVLCGTEVKSLRENAASLEDSYAKIDGRQVYLIGCEIPEYEKGNRLNHKPKRERKLLLHRREIEGFAAKATQKGMTLVPLRLYFKGGLAKVELAVARGKQAHDKRETQKKKDAERSMRQAMMRRR